MIVESVDIAPVIDGMAATVSIVENAVNPIELALELGNGMPAKLTHGLLCLWNSLSRFRFRFDNLNRLCDRCHRFDNRQIIISLTHLRMILLHWSQKRHVTRHNHAPMLPRQHPTTFTVNIRKTQTVSRIITTIIGRNQSATFHD